MENAIIFEKLSRYTQITKAVTENEMETGDQFSVHGIGYEILARVENRWTSTTCWAIRKIGTDKVIISFKSTKEIMDFIIDGLAFKVRFHHSKHKIRAHAGFVLAYNSIRKKVMSVIKQCVKDGDRITFLGHSLGGALTTLALLDFESSFPDSPLSAYTIGSPRVLDEKSAKKVEEIVDYASRGWNNRDLITKVPPKWMGFRHVGDSYRVAAWTNMKGFWRYHELEPYIQMFNREID
jgi:hypothetical protein